MHTCRNCGTLYPNQPEYWHSKNVCADCHRAQQRAYFHTKRTQPPRPLDDPIDPLIAPAQAKPVIWCNLCCHVLQCRALVNDGRPVLCAPTFESDLLLAKAYSTRKAIQC